MADYYDLLGVSREANDAEIKKAFRKQAHKYHPDKAGGDEQKFKEVNEAYQVLSDKTKRAQYDQYGQTFDGAGGGQGAGGFDFSQFGGQGGGFEFNFGEGGFSDIFGDVFGGGRRGRRGRDLQVRVKISFDEMIKGVSKEVSFRARRSCEGCDGTGGAKGSAPETCTTCGGAGRVQKMVRTMLGNVAQAVECDVCQGSGKTYKEKCSTCRGSGYEEKNVTEKVDIPAGIMSGQTIAFGGRGEAGESGSPAGDLLVVVEVTDDSRFERDEFDIKSDVHINFAQATLGDKIDVETVEGTVTMKIPSGTQSHEIFRIRDKGVPYVQRHGRGDHMVRVIVDIPQKMTRTQRKAIENLSDVL